MQQHLCFIGCSFLHHVVFICKQQSKTFSPTLLGRLRRVDLKMEQIDRRQIVTLRLLLDVASIITVIVYKTAIVKETSLTVYNCKVHHLRYVI